MSALLVVLGLFFVGLIGCDNDGGDNTDSETDTESSQDTDSGSENEWPPDSAVCEPILTPFNKVIASLGGLSFDAFLDASLKELNLRSPQTVSRLGLAQEYGMTEDQLDEVSYEYQLQTLDFAEAILALNEKFDENSLSYEQRIEHGTFGFYLADMVRRREFIYHPAQYDMARIPEWELQGAFSGHTIDSVESAEDYISRLEMVDEQFACYRLNLEVAEEKGLLPARSLLESLIPNVYPPGQAESTFYYETFAQGLSKLSGLTDAEEMKLLASAESAIEEAVIPALYYLREHVWEICDDALEENILWQYPDGVEYYDYLLGHYLGTEMTADEAHAFGLTQVEQLREDMDIIFEQLGYPEDETLAELYDRVEADAGYVPQVDVMTTYETMVADNFKKMKVAFDLVPTIPLIVSDEGYFAYRRSPDGIEPAQYLIDASVDAPRYAMPWVTYHEGVPGHHLQIALGQDIGVPYYRTYTMNLFGSYEGWAHYTERLAKDLGWYDGDLYADLGRLQAEIHRAVRVVADTGLHSKKWTPDEVIAYFDENVGYSEDDQYIVYPENELWRFLSRPGTQPGYRIGMNKIMMVRAEAMKALGDAFDLTQFHRAILLAGYIPFDTLDFVIQTYIDSGGKAPATVNFPKVVEPTRLPDRTIIE